MIQNLSTRQIINDALEKHGPLTRSEIAEITGLSNVQIGRAIHYYLCKGHVQIVDGRVKLSDGLFGPCVDASERGPGNMIFELCKRNWRGYQVHQMLSACRRASA
ncbi:hypothetical protein ICL29_004060 [Salmonella enterica]|nr:hypothetical protein [Salmonella enterica]EHK5999337.1 hypothetical protein [Salmonella enterica]EIF5124556.1 hypothetical protein [Salmonella enterica]EIF5348732.1 hypothetical protein [Salmonella enterica]EIF5657329.1 hypothetical protein [Salmonella enterica]